jgi:hypothetical protein
MKENPKRSWNEESYSLLQNASKKKRKSEGSGRDLDKIIWPLDDGVIN